MSLFAPFPNVGYNSSMEITTKRDGSFIMLQMNGTTLQGVWVRSHKGKKYFQSDTFGREYASLAEAKKHTQDLAEAGYWGQRVIAI